MSNLEKDLRLQRNAGQGHATTVNEKAQERVPAPRRQPIHTEITTAKAPDPYTPRATEQLGVARRGGEWVEAMVVSHA